MKTKYNQYKIQHIKTYKQYNTYKTYKTIENAKQTHNITSTTHIKLTNSIENIKIQNNRTYKLNTNHIKTHM